MVVVLINKMKLFLISNFRHVPNVVCINR